uniref:Uncharacterized protein n=1 Tax=Octopus bimaculoides TaxID=37653 RepID=A0A0L8I4V9_OCTBM
MCKLQQTVNIRTRLHENSRECTLTTWVFSTRKEDLQNMLLLLAYVCICIYI